MLRPPLLSSWDGLLHHRSTLHGTPLPAFVHRAADCKVRRAAPALSKPRPQEAPPRPPRPRVQPYPSCARSIPHQFQLFPASMPDPAPPPTASIPLLGAVLSRPPAPGPELTLRPRPENPHEDSPRFPALSVLNWAQGQPGSGGPARKFVFFFFACFLFWGVFLRKKPHTPVTSPSHTWFPTWTPGPRDAGSSLWSAMCPQKRGLYSWVSGHRR